MLILIGKTASGKDTISNKLISEYGYKKLITYTTRPIRKGEINDVTYHFVSDKEFKQKIKNNFFAEYKSYNTEFGTWYYGTALEDLKKSDDKTLIILTPQGYRDIKDKLSNKSTTVYVQASRHTIRKRLANRGDNPHEAKRRLKHDNDDFKGIKKEVDIVIKNNLHSDINKVTNDIAHFVEESIKR